MHGGGGGGGGGGARMIYTKIVGERAIGVYSVDEEEGGAVGRDAVEDDTVEREGDAVEGGGDAVEGRLRGKRALSYG